MLPFKVLCPIAVFSNPVVFKYNALLPTAVFSIACVAVAPSPLLYKALSPIATRLLKLVLFFKAFVPIATFENPLVLLFKAESPNAELLLPILFLAGCSKELQEPKATVSPGECFQSSLSDYKLAKVRSIHTFSSGTEYEIVEIDSLGRGYDTIWSVYFNAEYTKSENCSKFDKQLEAIESEKRLKDIEFRIKALEKRMKCLNLYMASPAIINF